MTKIEVLKEYRKGPDENAAELVISAEKRLSRTGGPLYRLVTVRRFRTRQELVNAWNDETPVGQHVNAL